MLFGALSRRRRLNRATEPAPAGTSLYECKDVPSGWALNDLWVNLRVGERGDELTLFGLPLTLTLSPAGTLNQKNAKCGGEGTRVTLKLG